MELKRNLNSSSNENYRGLNIHFSLSLQAGLWGCPVVCLITSFAPCLCQHHQMAEVGSGGQHTLHASEDITGS